MIVDLEILYSTSATIITSRDLTTLSKKAISGFQCLMTNLRMLSGCHSAFPSDLVHVNNIQGRWQHLSMSTVEQVLLRHGRAAESLLHTYTHTHTHIHNRRNLERILMNNDSFCFMALSWHWCIWTSFFIGEALNRSFLTQTWCSNSPHLHHSWWNNRLL